MLQKNRKRARVLSRRGRFLIVASKYNARHVDSMVLAAERLFKRNGAQEVRTVRVPGAYEIPVVTSALLSAEEKWAAAVCLGLIIRGQTAHAQLIGESVTWALMELQLRYQVPIIHEVLLVENQAQADQRCLDKRYNRGEEAAETALAMARIMASLSAGA